MGSPTDHGIISKEFILIDMRPLEETKSKSKVTRVYAQSG